MRGGNCLGSFQKKKMALSANSAFIKFQGDKLKQFQFSCLYVGARKRGLSFFCICGSLLYNKRAVKVSFFRNF